MFYLIVSLLTVLFCMGVHSVFGKGSGAAGGMIVAVAYMIAGIVCVTCLLAWFVTMHSGSVFLGFIVLAIMLGLFFWWLKDR